MPNCSSCQKPIPLDAPHGVCPACLLRMVGGAHPGQQPTMERSRSAPSPSSDREAIVRAFPQLEILELLGSGGMGAVYRVRQRSLDRIAALKLLDPDLAHDPSFQERFTREARLMARLVHPHIAMIFEFGQAESFFYLLMEYVDGINLRAAIRTRALSPADALRIVPQICDALQYAHDAGVIHRDIKPENILLDRSGHVKLVDFGLAKLHGSSGGHPSLTGTQQVMGTMNYMAPEQWERPNQIDHRADIFSLGVVFYELLTGELPLGKFSPPSARAAVDERIDPVVLRTLEKDPSARYQSAGEVKTAVGSVQSAIADRAAGPPVAVAATSSGSIASLPFTVGDYVQQWETNGIATLFPSHLHLEFTKRDRWFGSRQGVGAVDVALDDIASVRLRNGPFSKGLEIITKNLVCLRDFPYADDMTMVLRTSTTCLTQREQMYQALCQRLGQPPRGYAEQLRDVERARQQVQMPALGLFFSGVFDIVGALAALLVVAAAMILPSTVVRSSDGLGSPGQQTVVINSPPNSPVVPTPLAETAGDTTPSVPGAPSDAGGGTSANPPPAESLDGSLDGAVQAIESASETAQRVFASEVPGLQFSKPGASIGLAWALVGSAGVVALLTLLGLWQIVAGLRMRQLHNYGLCVSGSILAVTPIHPGILLGIPFGIWSLIVLCSEQVYSAFTCLAEHPDLAVPTKK